MQLQFDIDLFVSPELANEFICCICQTIYRHPFLDSCKNQKHTFCKECIQLNLQKYRTCPISRGLLKLADLKTDELTISKLNQLDMKCYFHFNKCNWAGKFEFILEHIKVCKFKTGEFFTRESSLESSKGDPINWSLLDFTNDINQTKLKKVKMRFIKHINSNGENISCLKSIQFVFEEQNSRNSKRIIFSPKLGNSTKTGECKIDKKIDFEIHKDDRVSGFVFYGGQTHFVAVGIMIDKKFKIKVFGYPELRKKRFPMVFLNNGQMIGFSGEFSQVVEKIRFQYWIHSDQK